jgi:hypothetical protein
MIREDPRLPSGERSDVNWCNKRDFDFDVDLFVDYMTHLLITALMFDYMYLMFDSIVDTTILCIHM